MAFNNRSLNCLQSSQIKYNFPQSKPIQNKNKNNNNKQKEEKKPIGLNRSDINEPKANNCINLPSPKNEFSGRNYFYSVSADEIMLKIIFETISCRVFFFSSFCFHLSFSAFAQLPIPIPKEWEPRVNQAARQPASRAQSAIGRNRLFFLLSLASSRNEMTNKIYTSCRVFLLFLDVVFQRKYYLILVAWSGNIHIYYVYMYNMHNIIIFHFFRLSNAQHWFSKHHDDDGEDEIVEMALKWVRDAQCC